ncbi:short chain dehydrogenase [Brevinema andersonii]|uniref:Short chain dehydrogenase n=1 Tax=Brevinema andersonii TaxID=34097 RepID=A0A1I1EXY9_BREAD|nr:SDR family NAD(P)-dependent oxidoreductase [Brevinema andersonii]SFB92015.1 short chain dehydrogenase [Brevinema andersonii]
MIADTASDIGTAVKQEFQQYNYLITDPTSQEWDLTIPKDISSYFRNNAKEYDTFVYCAGINNPELIENMPIERVQKTLQVNLLAFYAVLQYLIPFFKVNGEHIVVISSLYGTIAR